MDKTLAFLLRVSRSEQGQILMAILGTLQAVLPHFPQLNASHVATYCAINDTLKERRDVTRRPQKEAHIEISLWERGKAISMDAPLSCTPLRAQHTQTAIHCQ